MSEFTSPRHKERQRRGSKGVPDRGAFPAHTGAPFEAAAQRLRATRWGGEAAAGSIAKGGVRR